jgi:hypothetical protein
MNFLLNWANTWKPDIATSTKSAQELSVEPMGCMDSHLFKTTQSHRQNNLRTPGYLQDSTPGMMATVDIEDAMEGSGFCGINLRILFKNHHIYNKHESPRAAATSPKKYPQPLKVPHLLSVSSLANVGHCKILRNSTTAINFVCST